ncbi:MAG: putative Fe-S cluster assembly protein SufT [Saccharospirillum sp.]|nr:putative Fe-S cluster assembly protein SufT [Saccharospirillum sp.]
MDSQPQITKPARAFIEHLLGSQPPGTAVRLSVSKGGTPYAETTLAFSRPGQRKETDQIVDMGTFELLLDGKSLPFLKAVSLDVLQDSRSQRLQIHTPFAKEPLDNCERQVITPRELQASLIPSGNTLIIPAGSTLKITQALGSIFTLQFEGNLVRLNSEDARDLGVYTAQLAFTPPANGRICIDQVWEALASVYDPEIPVNIVSLGLIYGITLNQENGSVKLEMTLTAPGCGMGEVLVEDVRQRLLEVPFVKKTNIEMIFDPPWSIDRMSEEARLETGLYF